MPCLLRPPRLKKTDKTSNFQAYQPSNGSGEDGENEMSFTSRGSAGQRGERGQAPVLRQTNSVPVQMNKQSKNKRTLPPPPSAETLIPKSASKLSSSVPIRHPNSHPQPVQCSTQNGFKHRAYMEPCHQLSRTPELDEDLIDYASIEYDTPPDSTSRSQGPALPPRTYLNQTEVEYSDPILSPDMNEYDEPGEILRNSIPIHRVRTSEDSHSNHAHRFLPPPIPPKTASLLMETKRQMAAIPLRPEEDALESSQEVNSGILHNSIRPKDCPILPRSYTPEQNNRDSDVYLDMDPRETSSEMEKDIELQVHHTIKHQKGSSQEESSPTYVNVLFNTIATLKSVKQTQESFEVRLPTPTHGRLPARPLSSQHSLNSIPHDAKVKEQHYNMFTPVNSQPAKPVMPPTAPLSLPQQNASTVNSRRTAFGERMLSRPSQHEIYNRPLPSTRNSIESDSLQVVRRSSSADLLETPNRKPDKPPLLPKPKLVSGRTSGQQRRSSSSHECYSVNRTHRSDLPFKESLTRKRSAPSPTDEKLPRPILRGNNQSPERFAVRDREPRKVNFSGSTEVREISKQIDLRLNRVDQQRVGRSRSPVAHHRPIHPPPPPPTRRYSTSISQTNIPVMTHGANKDTRSTIVPRGANAFTSSTKGSTYPSPYMQPSLNGQTSLGSRQVQTLNRSSFFTNDEGRRERRLMAEATSDTFIHALKGSPNSRWDQCPRQLADSSSPSTHSRSLKLPAKTQRWVNMV